MSRLALTVLASAVAVTAATSAQAGCGCDYGPSSVVVQPAPMTVTIQQPPVLVQSPPVIVSAPIVQQYIVEQGPVYAGPMLTDYNPAIYYAPAAVGRYPYVQGYRASYAPRRAHRPYPGYPPIRRSY